MMWIFMCCYELSCLNIIVLVFYVGIGPELTTENILQSISAALHLSNIPVTGQNASKSAIQKHPNVVIDVNQPHIQVGINMILDLETTGIVLSMKRKQRC